jgi:hypothetical protein
MTLVGGPQRCMMLGSFFAALCIFSSLSAATADKEATDVPFYNSDSFIFVVTLITSILAGFGEALTWVAQGKYFADCATVHTKGFYFGYFWAFYMAS